MKNRCLSRPIASDRQCAWAFYVELSTRRAVTGDPKNPHHFEGEIYAESFDSLYAFFVEARNILRQIPVESINPSIPCDLHDLMHTALTDVLRPFLETWQADYRFWWDRVSYKFLKPCERQHLYPKRDEMLAYWGKVREEMQRIQEKVYSDIILGA